MDDRDIDRVLQLAAETDLLIALADELPPVRALQIATIDLDGGRAHPVSSPAEGQSALTCW